MPENRKYYTNNTVILASSRIEEGLPMVCALFMTFIIKGILARALSLYNITLCDFVFMGNHFHMLLVINDPAHVSAFIGYVKAEIAHAINRLLGRRRRTIWVDGFDSPVILTANDVMKYIEYIYLNPAKASLVDSINNYPGVSSWEMFKSGKHAQKCRHLYRTSIEQLPLPSLSVTEQRELVRSFEDKPGANYELQIEPFAWTRCFPEMEGINNEELKETIITRVEQAEKELAAKRRAEGKQAIGATELKRQSILKEHTPAKFSRKMICLCSDIALRSSYIQHFKTLSKIAYEAYQNWKRGDFTFKLPAGMFAPAGLYLQSAVLQRI